MDTEKLIERLRNRPNDSPLPAEYMMDEAADALEASTRRVKELEEALAVAANRLLMASINETGRPESHHRYEYSDWADEARTTLSQEGL